MSTAVDTVCNFCGTPTTDYHSGSYECRTCWDWRKLKGPAARYWAERIPQLMEQGPDMYDLMHYFRAAGITTEEAGQCFGTLNKLYEYSKAAIDARRK